MIFEKSIIDLMVDTVGTLGQTDRYAGNNDDIDTRFTPVRNSIKTQTKDLVLQFPYLVSNSCSFDMMKPLARALENEYANLLTIKLSSEINIVKGKGNDDVSEILKKYHTNYSNPSTSEYINGLYEANKFEIFQANRALMEDYDDQYESKILDEASYPTAILDEARRTKADIQADLDKAEEELEKTKNALDAANNSRERANKRAKDARNRADGIAARDTKDRLKTAQANRQAQADKLAREREEKQKDKDMEELKHQNKIKEKDYEHNLQTMSDLNDYTAHIVRNDAKKLNEFNPTIVETMINFTADGNNFNKKILFGVKGVTHLLSNKDVCYYLGNTVKNRNALFRLIQWTSGEIKLFRDLIFDIDRTKKLAASNNGTSSFWWNKLHNVGKTTFIRKAINRLGASINPIKYHDPIPTATMIVAMSDVDKIKYQCNIDLFNQPREVMRIMNEFFLLSFIIVDEASEMYYVYNEQYKGYDAYNKGQVKSFGEEEVKAGELKSRMF